MRILFLTNRPTSNTQAATVTEYLDALIQYSSATVYEVSMLHHFPARVDLDRFDVVITHYSLSLGPLLKHYLGQDLIDRLKRFRGLKAAFLQDEYREIQTYWKHLNDLGIDILFSCVPDNEISKVYPADKVPKLRVVNVLTGYVSDRLVRTTVQPVAERQIDVGYRTRRMPFWLGRLGHEKWFIAEEFQRRAQSSGLKLDLSTREGERLYGEAWTNFVASCKVVIGVESGASIIDFDGKIERRVDDFVAQKPDATFEEVFDRLLRPFEGSLALHQISPRCFEAAALRTPMVLFEGDYSGVLIPERHFIVLKKDFSNFDEVLSKIRDIAFLQEMANRTYQEVALDPRWSYRSFIEKIDSILIEECARRNAHVASQPYSKAAFDRDVRLSINYTIQRKIALSLQAILLGVPFARRALFGLWEALPRPLKTVARPLARLISR
jgi:hypothetical protein